MTENGSRRWRWPLRLLAVAGSAIALALVLRRLDLAALRATFADLHPGWYLAAVATFGLGLIGSALRWHLMLRLNHEAVVHGAASVRMVFISQFFNTLLGGAGPGDIPKTALYSRWYQVRASDVLAASVLDRLVSTAGGLIFAVASLAVGASVGAFGFFRKWEWHLPGAWVWVVLSVALALTAGLLTWGWRRPGSFAGRSLRSLRGSAAFLVACPRRSAHALGCAFLTATLFNLTQILCLQAVSPGPVPWLKLFWMFHLVTAIASLPVTVAGTGLREGAAMLLLRQYDIEATTAVAAALLTLTVHVGWALVGSFLLAREQARHRQLALHPRLPLRTISAVIPTLDEARALPDAVAALRLQPEVTEIIVADGGSTDDTARIAEALGCRLVPAPRGRGQQLQAGCAAATGDVLWMVHADTGVAPGAGAALLRCLRDPLVVGGGLWKRFRNPPLVMRGSRLRCWLRLWWNGRILGDQTFFVRRDALDAVGGVPPQALMEDVELSRRLRRVGRLALAGATVTASERRFLRHGIWRTYWTMWKVCRAHRRGVDPEQLRRIYEHAKH